MNKNVYVALIFILTPMIVLSHIDWSKTDDGWLFNVDGRDVDFAGIIQEKWRKASTSCRSVTELEKSDSRHKDIRFLIQSYSPPDSTQITEIHVWNSGDWAVAEVEFEKLLPAVITLKAIDKNPAIVEDAIWSGLTKPWVAGPFIRSYLSKSKNQAPRVLLDCFELQSKSFR